MRTLLSILCVSFVAATVHGAEVANIQENIRKLGFDRYYGELRRDKNNEPVKIAVLDYGFDNYQDELGYTIPKSTVFKQRPGDGNQRLPDDQNTHGLVMAQILTQYMTNNYDRWSLAPEIYLYKSDGYSNFAWAIDDAIKNGVDIILHSIVIEYGSNYDGKGFYNDLVNSATNAGIVWINAAGNFGLTTYNSKVSVEENNWVSLGDLEKNALPVTCDLSKSKVKSQNKKCNIRLVLAWDDFKNKPLEGSTKDLDLFLFDENFESTISSEMVQITYNDKKSGQAKTTLYPREIIETYIPEGTSYIKVKAMSDNFASSDQLRITADGDNISFPVRDKNESLLNPADNPHVITVGEDSNRSSVSVSLNKPELIAPSLVRGDDGRKYKGSSNAAAVVAAGIGLMKKINPSLDREGILNLARNSNAQPQDIMNYPGNNNIRPFAPPAYNPGYIPPPELNAGFIQSNRPEEGGEYSENNYRQPVRAENPYAVPLQHLGFGPLSGSGCFPLADIKRVDPCSIADFIIKSRGLLVDTTNGLKIATSFDPILLVRHPQTGAPDARANMNDVIAITPSFDPRLTFIRLQRGQPLPPGAVEIFKVPLNEAICKIPDWNFLMRQRDESRDMLYNANATGSFNQPISPMCEPGYMAQIQYPMSDWSMYPILQHTPYIAPIGPGPANAGYPPQEQPYNHAQYRQQQQPQQQYPQQQQQQQQQFQLPNPNDVKEN